MANAKISEWSQTAGSNTEIDGVPLGEGVMTPSNVNNAIRELMSQVAELYAGASGDRLPVSAGGTGSTSAAGARTNLGITGTSTATEILAGIAEIATAAETTTGTDDQRFITPLKLTTFAPASATIDTANDKIIIFDATDSKLKQATFPTSTPNRNYAQTTSRSSLSANTIPNDGTIPQITEGTEILSTTITPSSVSARIRITAVVPCYIDGVTAAAALFIAGTNDALAVDYKFVTATGSPGVAAAFVIQFEHVPGSASSQTYSVRCGPASGTLYINGNTSTQPFGAKQTASIVVQEVA